MAIDGWQVENDSAGAGLELPTPIVRCPNPATDLPVTFETDARLKFEADTNFGVVR